MLKVYSQLETVNDQFFSSYNGCAYKQFFGDLVSHSVKFMKQIKETADMIINRKNPTEELGDQLTSIFDRAMNVLDSLNQQIGDQIRLLF